MEGGKNNNNKFWRGQDEEGGTFVSAAKTGRGGRGRGRGGGRGSNKTPGIAFVSLTALKNRYQPPQ